jgi:hypothetical protein
MMYTTYASYLMDMEGIKHMGIADLRRDLGERIDAAYFHGEPTVIRHAKKDEPRAALVPYAWLQELYALRAERSSAGQDKD